MSARPFTLIAAIIFALMALVHVYRLVTAFPVTVGDISVSQGVSWIAVIVTAGLSYGLFREARR